MPPAIPHQEQERGGCHLQPSHQQKTGSRGARLQRKLALTPLGMPGGEGKLRAQPVLGTRVTKPKPWGEGADPS